MTKSIWQENSKSYDPFADKDPEEVEEAWLCLEEMLWKLELAKHETIHMTNFRLSSRLYPKLYGNLGQ